MPVGVVLVEVAPTISHEVTQSTELVLDSAIVARLDLGRRRSRRRGVFQL